MDVDTRTTRPGALAPGDVVLHEGALFEVVGTPFNGCSGSSVFDEFQVFWRVRLRPLEGAHRTVHATWGAGEDVTIVRPAPRVRVRAP
jgi:hypothetical protein